MNPPVILYYIGDGQYLAGVPGRDLSLDEVAALGLDPAELITSGCYSYLPPEYVAPGADIFPESPAASPEAPAPSDPAPAAAPEAPEEGAA